MEFRVLQKMFESGVFCGALVAPAPLSGGGETYNLLLLKKAGGNEFVCKTRSNSAKIYKSFSAAVNDASKVGFKTVTIELSKMTS